MPGIVPRIFGIVEPFGMQKRLRDHVRILKGAGGDGRCVLAAASCAASATDAFGGNGSTGGRLAPGQLTTRQVSKRSLCRMCLLHHATMKTQQKFGHLITSRTVQSVR